MSIYSSGICLSCNGILNAPFLDLGEQPLANSYLDPNDKDSILNEKYYSLSVSFCENCKLVQLYGRITPSILFTNYNYFSSYSLSFLDHAKRMALDLYNKYLVKYDSKNVLEIGSNDGYLLKYFQELNIPVLGIDPANNITDQANNNGIKTLNKFFSLNVVDEILNDFGKCDLIIGNNVLAHIPDINNFMEAISLCLSEHGLAVFEFPYLLDLVENNEFDTIYHEHVFYYSVMALLEICKYHKLEIFDIQRQELHGGTLRVFIQNNKSNTNWMKSINVDTFLWNEKKLKIDTIDFYIDFSKKVKRNKLIIMDLVEALYSKGNVLATYGASAKGNTLLNYCGINSNIIEFGVDISPYKQNKLLPGSHIPILHPYALIEKHIKYTLLLSWNWEKEIVEQQKDYLRSGKFIIPIPNIKII